MSPSLADTLDRPRRTEPRPDGVTIAHILGAMRRRWRWIAIPTLLAALAATAFVQLVTPRYTGEAKILLESRDTFYTRPSGDRAEPVPLIDEQAVASQVQVIMSRDLAREAIRRLGLVGNEEFDPLAEGLSPLRQILVMLGLAKDPLGREPEERVLDNYFRHLSVYPAGKSRVVTIEFRSKDPELAARGANTVAEVYLEAQETAKSDTARSASAWLGTNVSALRTRLAESERKVEEFRARNGLFAGGTTNSNPIGAQQLAELSTQLSQARSAQADAQAKARLIKEMIQSGRTFEIPDVANNELIRRLIEQRVSLRAQLALERRTLLAQHPRIKELNAQLADLESQIRAAAERTTRTLENDARIAGSRVETLQAALDAQKTVVTRANENEVQLRALERDARIQREQLESYMSRFREASARDAGSAVPADARIVSRAVVPDLPSFPKKLPIIAFATLAAFLFSSGSVVAREVMGGPRLEDEPVDRAGESFAPESRTRAGSGRALIPYGGLAASAAAGGPGATLVPPDERYDLAALIARLERQPKEGRGRRVVVTGLSAATGATEDLAFALGRLLAQGASTLLIAFDSSSRGEREGPGFSDLVMGEVSFSETIARERGSRLHRVGPGLVEATRLADEPEGVDLALSAFDQSYAWIVGLLVEAGAAGGTLLAMLAARADAVVIVSEEDPADPALVGLYNQARDAGAPDVIVARETALAAESAV